MNKVVHSKLCSSEQRSTPNGLQHFPLITVAITCFNAESTIERAISSGLNQSWPNLEVLVVDDGSTDNSLDILACKSASDERIRIVKHSINRGCAEARNTLIAAAKGEFVAFFDDDDVSLPDRLQLQFDCIISHEKRLAVKLVACYASGQRIYPNGYVFPLRAVGSYGTPPEGLIMVNYLLFNKRQANIFYGAGTPTCSLMARADVFRNLEGFDPLMRRQEDVDFAVRLGFKGGHFIGISQPVLNQYATIGNEKSALIEFESTLRLLDKNIDYLKGAGTYHYMRLWSEMRFLHFSGRDARAFTILLRLVLRYPLRTLKHFSSSAIRRFYHEQSMKATV